MHSTVVLLSNMNNSNKIRGQKRKRNVYNTRYSQAVTHPSTNRARRCLTSVIRRELVCSTWYGRRQQLTRKQAIYNAVSGMVS